MCQTAPLRCCRSVGFSLRGFDLFVQHVLQLLTWTNTQRIHRKSQHSNHLVWLLKTFVIRVCCVVTCFILLTEATALRKRCLPERDEANLTVNVLQGCIVTTCQRCILMDVSTKGFPPEHWPKHHAASVSLHSPTMHPVAMRSPVYFDACNKPTM